MVGGVLFTGGKIATLDSHGTVAEALVARDERILAVGSAHELELQFGRHGVKRVDLGGKTVVPGWIDSHAHLIGYGMKLLQLSLGDVTDRAELIRRLKEKVAHTPPGEWIVGMGWDDNHLSGGDMLNRFDLDELSQVHPILLIRVCTHVVVVNSLALKMAGMDRLSADPPGGKILRTEDGEPNGFLLEKAAEMMKRHVPEMTKHQLEEATRLAILEAHRLGLTSVHTEDIRYAGGVDQTWSIYRRLIGANAYRLRCHLLIHHDGLNELCKRNWSTGYGDNWVKVGAMKIFADGSLGGRGAWLSEPYADAPDQTGVRVHCHGVMLKLIQKARRQGLAVAVHAIGDAALEQTLSALERVPSLSFPDRLIHVQVVRPDLVTRMKKSHVVADIQPRFVVSDLPWVKERLGASRLKWSYAWKTLMDAGIPLAGGSDAPVEPLNPLLGVHAAETRRAPGAEHEGFFKEQRLSRMEAIRLFTIGGAYASGELDVKGTLEPGKLADFVVLSHDIVDDPDPDVLLDAKTEMTVVGGEIVYSL